MNLLETKDEVVWNHSVEVKDIDDVKKKLIITYDADGVEKALTSAAENVKPQVKLSGFRKGKVPVNVIKRLLRKELESVAGALLAQEGYLHACYEHNIKSLGKPTVTDVTFKLDGTFVCELDVDVKPPIELNGYFGLELTKPQMDRGSLIEKEIANVKENHAIFTDVEKIVVGNKVVVDFSVKHEGKEIALQEDFEFIATSDAGPFGSSMLGLSAGDVHNTTMEIPDTLKEYAGKTGDLSVTVKSIQQKDFLELSDISEKMGKSLDEITEEIDKNIDNFIANRVSKLLEEQVIDVLIENNEFDVPEQWVKDEKTFMERSMGLTQSQDEKFDEYLLKMAERSVRRAFILDEIASQEKVEVTQEDVNQFIKMEANKNNVTEDVVKKELKERDMLDGIIGSLRHNKAINLVLNQAIINEPKEEEKEA